MNDATDRTPFEQQAEYLARRLPPVIISNTDPTGRGRGKASTRPLPPPVEDAAAEAPLIRGFSILILAAVPGERHLAFCGRCYARSPRPAPHDDRVELHSGRGFVGALARRFLDDGAVDTTATEVA